MPQRSILVEVDLCPFQGLAHGADLPFRIGVLPGAHGHAGGIGTPEAVQIAQRGTVADTAVRIPPCRPRILILVSLRAGVPGTLKITSPQRHGTPQQFDVDPVPASGAVVDQQMRKTLQQGIPETVQIVDVVNLGRAAPILQSVLLLPVAAVPEIQRCDVAVLPVAVNRDVPDVLRSHADHVLADTVQLQLCQPVLGVRIGSEAVRSPCPVNPHALRLKPEQEPDAVLFQKRRDVPVTVRMVVTADLPASGLHPLRGLFGCCRAAQRLIPARVDPAVIKG